MHTKVCVQNFCVLSDSLQGVNGTTACMRSVLIAFPCSDPEVDHDTQHNIQR